MDQGKNMWGARHKVGGIVVGGRSKEGKVQFTANVGTTG
jgi:hypothetical protein